jgi:glycosyltransferase involved in cell wall biosynthesis
MKFSIVIPVHNEEKYLPYCIAGLLECPLYEVVFVLDRCSDRSLEIVESVDYPFRVKVEEIKKKKWNSPTAEPVFTGFKEATGDVAYAVGSDFYLDPSIFKVDWTKIDVCSFELNAYALYGDVKSKFMAKLREQVLVNYEKMKSRMKHLDFGTGLYAFRTSMYKDFQHVDYDSEDSYFLNTSIKKGYRYRYVPSKSLHLRPQNPRSLKFRAQIGVANYHVTLPRAMFYTFKYLDTIYLREYLTARASSEASRIRS